MAENWTDEELEAAVRAYVEMRDRERRGERVVKSNYYRDLHNRFGRLPNAPATSLISSPFARVMANDAIVDLLIIKAPLDYF